MNDPKDNREDQDGAAAADDREPNTLDSAEFAADDREPNTSAVREPNTES